MSDWGDLFTSFYNQFILRDLLSMVLPGLTVIFVFSLFFNGQKFSFLMFKIFENSWISVLFVLAMAYFIGVMFIGISDRTRWFKTYYTDLPEQYQEITKNFIEGLSSRDEKTRERYLQIRERYIIFTQSCGNFAWTSITSILLIIISSLSRIGEIIFPELIFLALLILSAIGYKEFINRQERWDKLFLSAHVEKSTSQKEILPNGNFLDEMVTNKEIPNIEMRVSEIFSDLQKDRINDGKTTNLISKDHQLIPDKTTLNFQGDSVRKQIKYNPDYLRDNTTIFTDAVLKFCLLHEEAHIIRSKSKMPYFPYAVLFIVIILGIVFIFYPSSLILKFPNSEIELSSIPLYAIVLIFGLLICIPIIWRYSWDVMNEDEFDADDYAASSLVNIFHIQHPAQIILPYFTMEHSDKEKKIVKDLKFKMRLIGTYPPYHPANCERIENIRKKFPD